MAKNFQKAERNIKIDGEYKLLSYASSSESVEMTDGTDLQTKMDSVDSNISNEISRATAKENEIASNLSAEVTRATSAEQDLDSTKADKTSVYTKNEVDNKFSTLETNIDWKESVATYSDIATTYPNPEDGWTVNVKDTDYTYRYKGTEWVAISANAIPKATDSVDGLLSKEDHANYEDANSKKHTHSNKSVIDGISSTNVSNWNSAKTHADSTHARTDATKAEKSSTNGNIKINGTETTVYTHPSGTNPHGTTKSDVGLGNVGNFKAVSTVASQGLTDTEKSNARANIGAGTSSFSGSYNDLSNKPTIPSVGNGTITIKQAGTSKGTFTMNQSGNTTIELTDNNTTYSSKSAASGGTDVSLVTTGEKYTWNNKANASHGNHVPTTQTANNAVFLRNDNTWQTVTPANIGAAASSHTHSVYVNQNAFSNVTVGSTTVSADSATDTLTLVAGSNVTITPDATNDKITIASTDTNTWRGISSTYTSSITNASTTSFSQEGAYNLYTALNSNLSWESILSNKSSVGTYTVSTIASAREILILFGFSNQTQASIVIPYSKFSNGADVVIRDSHNSQYGIINFVSNTSIKISEISNASWVINVYYK